MKVTVIWSSPNPDGLTAAAKESLLRGLAEKNAEMEEFCLNQMSLKHCAACGNGWGSCREEGKCALKDDFEGIYESLVHSDGFIFVSAVYWSDMTEAMKAFVDRLRRCEAVHNHFLQGKRGLLVACAGGTGNGTLECLEQMEKALRHMSMRAYDRLPVTRFNRDYMLPALEKAGSLYADRLVTGFDMYY